MQFLLYPLAILAGLMNPLQAACTSGMNKAIHRPFLVGLVTTSGTFTVALIGTLLLGQLGFNGKAPQVPWWAWFGGLVGAVFLLSQPVVAPKIGAGPFIGLTVTSSTILSVAIDHYGWLGFPQHTASVGRLVGTGLMVVGVGLVAAL